jgi:hypothetical protein
MKNKNNYIAASTATLTQSGLLAALLEHQRRKVIELNQRRAQRQQARGLVRNSVPWLLAHCHSIIADRRFRRASAQRIIARHI